MTVDPELVTRKLLLIARDLDELAAIRDRGQESYLASRVDQAVAERHLERMIGRMIDVNYHLLTGSGQAPPNDDFGSFTQLASIGVVEVEQRRGLADLETRAGSNRDRPQASEVDKEDLTAISAPACITCAQGRHGPPAGGHIGKGPNEDLPPADPRSCVQQPAAVRRHRCAPVVDESRELSRLAIAGERQEPQGGGSV